LRDSFQRNIDETTKESSKQCRENMLTRDADLGEGQGNEIDLDHGKEKQNGEQKNQLGYALASSAKRLSI
jgi:hypothetical protein